MALSEEIKNKLVTVGKLETFKNDLDNVFVEKDENGDVIITGNLQVKGSTQTVNQENLAVKDNIIITNANGGAVPDTGIVAVTGSTINYIKGSSARYAFTSNQMIGKVFLANNFNEGVKFYNSDDVFLFEVDWIDCLGGYPMIGNNATGGIPLEENHNYFIEFTRDTVVNLEGISFDEFRAIFDIPPFFAFSKEEAYAAPIYIANKGTLKIGQGYVTRDEKGSVTSFEFVEGQAQSIATRSDEISDKAFVSWDYNSNMLVEANLANGTGLGSIKSSNLNDDDRPYTEEELPVASGHEAIAFGKKAKATGKRSIAVGNNVQATGNTSIALGQVCTTNNDASITGGNNCTNTGDHSIVWGTHSTNNSRSSAIFGTSNLSNGGFGNFSVGYGNILTTQALGENYRNGNMSALGHDLTLSNVNGKVVTGRYNLENSDAIFEVGNGLENGRSNAFEVLEDGRAKVYGVPIDDNDIVRKADIQNGSLLNITNGEGSGAIQQVTYEDDSKNSQATGLGAVAFGGFRGDKTDESPNPIPDDDATVNNIDQDEYNDTMSKVTGIQAVVFGAGNRAYGDWDFIVGKDNKTTSRGSFVFGGKNYVGDPTKPKRYLYSMAVGALNTISSEYAFAAGQANTLSANGNQVLGYGNTISGLDGKSIGNYNFIDAAATDSITVGVGLKSYNPKQLILGRYNSITDSLLIVGNGNRDADRSNAFEITKEGVARAYGKPVEENDLVRFQDTTTNLKNGTGLGSIKSSNLNDDDRLYTQDELPIASGHESIAFGKKVKATGKRSVAIGNGNISSGNTSFTIGQLNDNSGNASLVTGYKNINSGTQTFINGANNEVSATCSTILGYGNKIPNGTYLLVSGYALKTIENSGTKSVFGVWNDPKSNTLLEIGNGKGTDSTRSNAFEVLEDGRAKVYGAARDSEDIVNKEFADSSYIVTTTIDSEFFETLY